MKLAGTFVRFEKDIKRELKELAIYKNAETPGGYVSFQALVNQACREYLDRRQTFIEESRSYHEKHRKEGH